ncbi:MAG: DUF4212 domain-containing protein [Candidatus Methanomethyliales bacterium]|nr:DUF4212 domain-containing protein [Candidatus Methanomethylicales archaeon]
MPKIDDINYPIENSGKATSDENESEGHMVKNKAAQWYWRRLKVITAVWMIAWSIPAVVLHIPIGATSSIKILNGIPLHWFNAALLSIIIGVILIFLYAFLMDRTDRIIKLSAKESNDAD